MPRVFFLHPGEWPLTGDESDYADESHLPSGWYWQSDGMPLPIGPFASQADATADTASDECPECGERGALVETDDERVRVCSACWSSMLDHGHENVGHDEPIEACPRCSVDEWVEQLARSFARELEREIGRDALRSVVKRNAESNIPGACASHDFCDSSMVMDAVFADLANRPADLESDTDRERMERAWSIARAAGFWI